MRRLLVLLALLAAPLAFGQASAARNWARATCGDDRASCREDCSMLNGTQLNRQGRLAACVRRCDEEAHRCEFRKAQALRALDRPRAPMPASGTSSVPLPVSSGPAAQTASSTATGESHPDLATWSAPAGSPSSPAIDSSRVDATPPPSDRMAPASATSPLAEETSDRAPVPTAPSSSTPDALTSGTSALPSAGSTPRSPAPSFDQALPSLPSAHHGPDNSADALLDHPTQPAHHLEVQHAAQREPSSKLPPMKKDLSEWDPEALE